MSNLKNKDTNIKHTSSDFYTIPHLNLNLLIFFCNLFLVQHSLSTSIKYSMMMKMNPTTV